MTDRVGIACFMYPGPKVRADKEFDSFKFCLDQDQAKVGFRI